jgi:hypothetical protein
MRIVNPLPFNANHCANGVIMSRHNAKPAIASAIPKSIAHVFSHNKPYATTPFNIKKGNNKKAS